jgi:hypothetical protein
MRVPGPAWKSILLWLLLLSCAPQAVAGGSERALLWSIESDQGRVGYLLGTIHSEDPRVLEFTDAFLEALHGCSHFAMELVPNLPTLAGLTEAMRLPPQTELAALVGVGRFEAVVQALGAYGVDREQAARMKPWAAMMTLSVPPPKTGFFMDFSLSLRASGQGLTVIGLETLEEQLKFLEDMSLSQQLSLLDQALAETAQVQQVHDRMVDIYLSGDLEALRVETMEQLSVLEPGVREVFLAEGIAGRNHRMFARLLESLQLGTVFAAVGALHLPGEEGLIALLRNAGYRVSAMPPPFPPRN